MKSKQLYIISAIKDLDGYNIGKQNTFTAMDLFLKKLWTVFGIFTNFEDAEKEVLTDKGHIIYQYLYQFVVIQRLNYGLWIQTDKQYFYKWSDKTNSYQKIRKPRKLRSLPDSHCASCF